MFWALNVNELLFRLFGFDAFPRKLTANEDQCIQVERLVYIDLDVLDEMSLI